MVVISLLSTRVAALTAFANTALLEQQASRFQPLFVGLVRNGTDHDSRWRTGERCLVDAATRDDVDIVINAVVGAAGFDATLAALEAGKRVALANKETLVMAGELARAAAKRGGGEIVPVDSEHSAILQCVTGRRPATSVGSSLPLGRTVPCLASRATRSCHRRRRVAPSNLDDGPEDHGGQRNPREQGARGHRGTLSVRAPVRPYRGGRPSAERGALARGVRGRAVMAQLGAPTMELPVLYALTHPERVPDTGYGHSTPSRARP